MCVWKQESKRGPITDTSSFQHPVLLGVRSITSKFCINSGWWEHSLSLSPWSSLATLCTNLTLQRRACAYLPQGIFLLYLETFWPSVLCPSPHVYWKLLSLECSKSCFSAGQAWLDCWGLLQEGQWTGTGQHPFSQMGVICPSAPDAHGVFHQYHCMGRTRWC